MKITMKKITMKMKNDLIKNPLINLAVIGAVLLIVAFIVIKTGFKETYQRPDIILITADSVRQDHLSVYGYDVMLQNHAINDLASGSVLFDNAYTPSPVSIYAYGSLMTGLYSKEVFKVRGDQVFRVGNVNTLAAYLRNAGYSTTAIVGDSFLAGKMGFSEDFDEYLNFYLDRPPTSISEHITEKALEKVREMKKNSAPSFLWIQYPLPRFPFSLTEKEMNDYIGNGHPYDLQIFVLDLQIAKLNKAIKKAGMWNKAIIIFTSATGAPLGEHSELTKGMFVYQSSVKIPLIIRIPMSYAGKKITEPVSLMDITPTILGFTGIEHPAGNMDGRDLLPLIESGEIPERNLLLVSEAGHSQYGWSPVAAVVSGKHKYIELPETELYDLDKDPHELNNIAAEQPETAARLKNQLADMITADMPELTSLLSTGADPKKMVNISNIIASVRPKTLYSSIALTKKILEEDPDNRMALLLLGRDYYRDGRLESSKNTLEELLSKYPDSNKGWELLGMVYDRQGIRDKALEAYEKALEIYPDSPITLNNLAWIYAEKGENLQQALEYSEKAVELVPESPSFLDTLACVNEKLGNKEKAEELRAKITEMAPKEEIETETEIEEDLAGEYTS